MRDHKTTLRSRRSERGNVFFTLFGAVAIVGVLGAGIMATMRGPLSTMVEVNRRTQAESHMSIAAKLAMLESAAQALSGDCDSDGYVEPLEYAANIAGLTGGGTLPATIGTNRQDPWSSDYGYCVWDAGPIVDDAGCGGVGQTRLAGNGIDDPGYTMIAIISAGPDRTFQATCTDHPGLITRGGDDLVMEFNYQGAAAATGGLWNIKTGAPDTAEIAKDIEVTGGASFTAGIDLTTSTAALQLGAASMLFPDQGVLTTCNGANHGLLRVNTLSDPDHLQICDNPNGWVSVADGAPGANLWTDLGGNRIHFSSGGTGQVGVLNDNPSEALDVTGNIELSGNAMMTDGQSIVWGSGSQVLGNAGVLQLDANGGTGVEINIGPDIVGIGTAAVATNTLLVQGATADDTENALHIRDSGTTSLLLVQNDGDVGIGVANPNDALDVAGAIDADSYYKIDGITVLNTDNTMGGSILVGGGAGSLVTGDNNTIVGGSAGNALTTGTYNTVIGNGGAPTLATGDNNIVIGSSATPPDVPLATTSDYLNIGNTLYGDLANDRIGIGVAAPDDALDVLGSADITTTITAGTGITSTTGNIVATAGNVTAGSTMVVNGDQLGPPLNCNTATQKLEWTNGVGWSCETDLGSGGGGGGQNLDDVLTEGNDAQGQDAEDFDLLGANQFCESDLTNCFTAADILGGSAGLWTQGPGADIYYNSGTPQVGIGNTAPSEALHVTGTTRTDILRAGNGTAGIPSLSFINDTNTGLYSIGADTIGVSTNGAERLRVTSNGYVGINETSPDTGTGGQLFLDVEGNTGSIQYCDELGNNCFTAASVANNGNAPGSHREVIFNSNGAFHAEPGFTFTSNNRLVFSSNSNVFISGGNETLSGARNVVVGASAGDAITTASDMVAVGDGALNNSASGNYNTAIGSAAMGDLVSGAQNTALGGFTLNNNETGRWNTVLGYAAGEGVAASSDVSENVFIGRQAAENILTGADDNTIIGTDAAATLTTGASNIIIGRQADVPLAATSNYINIGDTLFGETGTGLDPRVGTFKYCDENLATCFTAADIAGGSTGAPGLDREMIFNSGGVLGTDTNLVFTSTGRIGIGNAAPAQTLDVTGTAAISGATTVGGSLGVTGIATFTNDAQLKDGSAADPSLTFTNSATTGLFRAAADSIGVATAGTEKMRVTAAGQLLIGDTTVSAGDQTLEVDVTGDIGATNYCDADGNNCFLATDVANNTVPGLDREVLFNSNGVAGTDANFVFTSTGLMGIGTNTPLAALDVTGTDAILFPRGDGTNRPAAPVDGMMRYNTVTNKYEARQGGAWSDIITSGAGGITFLDLNDTPADYTGVALDFLRVNAGATGLEYVSASAFDDQNLEEVLTIGNNANTLTALNLGGIAVGSATLTTGGEQDLEVDVTGDLGATNYCDAAGNNCFLASDVANNTVPGLDREILFNSNGVIDTNTNFVFTNAGLMGVGTANPIVSLDLGANTDAVGLPLGTTAERPASLSNGLVRYNSDNAKFEGYEAGAWTDFVTTGGGGGIWTRGSDNDIYYDSGTNPFVGIGITDPITDLHIKRDGDVGTFTFIENTTDSANARAGTWVVSATSEGGTGAWPDNSTLLGAHFADRFTVLASDAASSAYGGVAAGLDLIAADASADMRFYTGGRATTDERMRIEAGGDIGIGTASPASDLHIYDDAASSIVILEGDESGNTILELLTSGDGASQILSANATGWSLGARGDTHPTASEQNDFFMSYWNGATASQQLLLEYDTGDLYLRGTGAIDINAGTTAERPVSPDNGMLRYNSDNNRFEGFQAGIWQDILTGASIAAAPDRGIQFNSGNTMAADANFVYTSAGLGLGTTSPVVSLDLGGRTDALLVPLGTNVQRPASLSNGLIRYNSDNAKFEGYEDGDWADFVTTGAGGGGIWTPGSDDDIYYNSGTAPQVGIGTATPTVDLHVSGGLTRSPVVIIAPDTVDDSQDSSLRIGEGLGADGVEMFYDASNNDLTFRDIATTSQIMTLERTGNVGIGTVDPIVSLDLGANTDALLLPLGTVAERPASLSNGLIRYNSDNAKFEGYEAGAWTDFVTAGAGGGGIWTPGSFDDIYYNSGTAPQVGIGTTAPTNILSVVSTDGSEIENISYSDTANEGADFETLRARNTEAAPNPVAADDKLGGFRARAWDGTQYELAAGFEMYVDTGATVADEDIPTHLRFHTRSATDTSWVERMRIDSDGNVGIGTTTPAIDLHIYDGSGWGSLVAEGDETGGSALHLLTAGDAASVGDAQAKGWAIEAYGDAYATVSEREDMLFAYWDGATWTGHLSMEYDTGDVYLKGTGAIDIMAGTTAERPTVPDNGMLRYNSDNNRFEGFQAGLWQDILTGASIAAAPDRGIQFNSGNTLAADANFVYTSAGLGLGTTSPIVSLDLGGRTDALLTPLGTTAERPASLSNGLIRYNSDSDKFEGYENGAWTDFTTGAAVGTAAGVNSEIQFNSNGVFGTHETFVWDDTNHHLGIGTANPTDILTISGGTNEVVHYAYTSDDANYDFSFARGSEGAEAVVQANDVLGGPRYYAWDSTQYERGAQILAYIDAGATPANENLPTHLRFDTREATDTTSVERMRLTSDGDLLFYGTGAIDIHAGTTAERPTVPDNGMLRYNSDNNRFEGFQAGVWQDILTGASIAAAPDRGIQFNSGNTMAADANFIYTSTGQMAIGVNTPYDASVTMQVHAQVNSYEYITSAADVGTGGKAQQWFALDTDGTVNWAGIGQEDDGSLRLTGGTSLATPHMTLTDAGNVGIGTVDPIVSLDLGANTDALLVPLGTDAQRPASLSNGLIRYNSDNAKFEGYENGGWINFATGQGGHWTAGSFDDIYYNSGTAPQVGIGLTDPTASLHIKDTASTFVMEGEDGAGDMNLYSYGDSADPHKPDYGLRRARGTMAGPTVVQNDDFLGTFRIFGYDGDTWEEASIISTIVDNTPGDGDMPARMEFHVAQDGGVVDYNDDAPEMVIKSDGNVGIGTPTPISILHLAGDLSDTGLTVESFNGTNAEGAVLLYRKATGETDAAKAIVAAQDEIAHYGFQSYDGTAYRQSASMIVSVDGTPGANDTPGRFDFWTVPDGSTSQANRMRIDNKGDIFMYGTGALRVPAGTDGERPVALENGLIRYNSDNDKFEGYEAGAWANLVGAGAVDFLTLTDTPGAFSSGGRYVRINSAENALEFTDLTVEAVTGAPAPAGMVFDDLDDVAAAGANLGDGVVFDGTNWVTTGGNTDALIVPLGTTAQRPAGVSNGMLRYNSDNGKFEGYQAGAWTDIITAGGTAAGANSEIQFNSSGAFGTHETFVWDDANGRMGIGETTPTSTLHVKTGTSLQQMLHLRNDADAIDIKLGTSAAAVAYLRTGAGDDLGIGTNNTDHIYIQNGGNIGIGSTTPIVSLDLGANTDALLLPLGTTAERPASLSNGLIRYNSDNDKFEGYEAGAWADLIGGGGSFTGLTDTPGAYTSGGMFVRVNSGATALEFTNSSIESVTGAPAPTGMTLDDLDNVVASGANVGDGVVFDGTNFVLTGANTGALTVPLGTTGQQPASLSNGMIRYNSTTSKFEGYEAGAWANMIGGGGSGALSDITAATAGSTIANGANEQTWQWQLTVDDTAGMVFEESTASTNGTTWQPLVNIATLPGSTAEPLGIINAGNGDSFVVLDSDPDTTPFVIDNAGNVGIGTATPEGLLHVPEPDFADLPLMERTNRTTDAMWSALRILATKTTNMGDDFGTDIAFNIQDDAGVINEIANIGAARDGADNSGQLKFRVLEAGAGSIAMTIRADDDIFMSGTGALRIPAGTDGERPATLENGLIRYNSTGDKFEGYQAGSWQDLIGGGGSSVWTAGTGDDIYYNSGVHHVGIGMTDPDVELDVTGDIEFTGTITDVSDRRLKDNITPLDADDIIERLGRIDTYSFTMKDDPTDRIELGVMAQEVEKAFPELVKTAEDEMGTKSVNYMGFIAPLIEATNELREENAVLRTELSSMKTETAKVHDAVSNLTKQVELLNKAAGNNVGKASMESWVMVAALFMLGMSSLFFVFGGILRARRRDQS